MLCFCAHLNTLSVLYMVFLCLGMGRNSAHVTRSYTRLRRMWYHFGPFVTCSEVETGELVARTCNSVLAPQKCQLTIVLGLAETLKHTRKWYMLHLLHLLHVVFKAPLYLANFWGLGHWLTLVFLGGPIFRRGYILLEDVTDVTISILSIYTTTSAPSKPPRNTVTHRPTVL